MNEVENLYLEFNTDGNSDEFGGKFIKGVIRVIKVWPDEIYFDKRFDTVTLPFNGIIIEQEEIQICIDEEYPSNFEVSVYDIINMISKGTFNFIDEKEFSKKFIEQMYETADMIKEMYE